MTASTTCGDVWRANHDASIQWTLFDRWGEALFAPSAQQQACDGTFGGKPLPNGSYVWKGHAPDPATGATRELRGHVLLMR